MLDQKPPQETLIDRKRKFQTVSGKAALFIYLKSIRIDEAHYALEFLNSVIQCQDYRKDPLRPPSTARYKVTYRTDPDSKEAKACIMLTDPKAKLTKEEEKTGVVTYQAMHTQEKKAGFSPKQSASLLTPETYVNVFGFDRGTAPLAGFIFTEPNTLGGGYHGLYDSGTIGRPYRTHSLAKAREKLTKFQEKIYATPEKMAEALNKHTKVKDGRYHAHTESLVRVRLTPENPGKIAIFKDDQASRWYALYLQALTAAQFKEQAEAAGQKTVGPTSESITPPIYYYLPDSLCFTDYTAAEQSADREAAEAINSNENQAFEKVRNKEFWFLLGLSKERLAARLNSTLKVEGVDMPVLSYLMLTGYVGLARGLAKLAGIKAGEEKYWVPFRSRVAGEEKESDSHPLLAQVHPQFIGQAALHFPTEYKGLDPRLLEAKDSNGDTALHTAAYLGFPKRVAALLVADKINVNARDLYDKTPLHWAAANGDLAVVNALIQKRAKIHAKDIWNKTPLHLAALRGHSDVVKALFHADPDPLAYVGVLKEFVLAGADVARKINGQPILHWAAANGHVDLVNALIRKGANINARDEFDRTPLHWAAEKGHVAVVKKLVLAGADATGINISGQPILHWAAENIHLEVVKKLVLAGADATGINISGQPILHWAAENIHLEVVKKLVLADADATGINISGQPILHWAAEEGHGEVVKALLKQPGIDVNAADSDDRKTPLHRAAEKGNTAVVEALLKHSNIQINAADHSGDTPLHRAAANRHISVVEALLQHRDIKVNAEEKHGKTPLHWAACRGYSAVVQALLLKQPDIEVNAADRHGYTPLYWAAFYGYGEVVKALLKQPGIDVNAADSDDRKTPLRWAAEKGHGEVVKALLKQPGIDVNAKDNNGTTPLYWAAKNGYLAVVKALLKADQQGKLFQGAILIERSAVVVGALFSSCLFAESINPKGWIDTLSQALQSQVGSALCAAVLLAGCAAACRQLFYLHTRAAYAKATCRQQVVIVGGKLLMTGAAATLFTAVAFPQTGLIALCNNPVTAGIVLGAVCLIGVADYLSDRTYTTVISASEAGLDIV